jgi:hypothetical protein
MPKSNRDPIAIAKSLRRMFKDSIPTTWAEYYRPHNMTAYNMTLLIREQMHETISFQDAASICLQVNPELSGEYWDRLPVEQG